MVNIDPDNVDNQQDEEINFDGDCNICNEEELSYFYWNSSIDGILHEGSNDILIQYADATGGSPYDNEYVSPVSKS